MNGGAGPTGTRLRALRRWDENGFDELSVGLGFCAAGGSLPLADWIVGQSLPVIVTFVMLATTLAIGFVIQELRVRLVYPRTGYVVFRRTVSRKWIAVGLLAFGALFAAADSLWRLNHLGRAWGPASGLLFAATLAWGGIRYRTPRYLWLAGFSLVLGGVTFAAGANTSGALWVMLAIGVAMALEGALRLKHFLRTHPIVEDFGEDQHG